MNSRPPPEGPIGGEPQPNRSDAAPPPPSEYSAQNTGQQNTGQPPDGGPAAGSGRPVWRTVLGSVLIGIAVLAVLGQLVRLITGQGAFDDSNGDPGYAVGVLIGAVLTIGVPLVVGILLLRKGKRDIY